MISCQVIFDSDGYKCSFVVVVVVVVLVVDHHMWLNYFICLWNTL